MCSDFLSHMNLNSMVNCKLKKLTLTKGTFFFTLGELCAIEIFPVIFIPRRDCESRTNGSRVVLCFLIYTLYGLGKVY